MNNIQSSDTIILNLLRGAVPEKADALCQSWEKYEHEIEVVQSSLGATMNATSKRIQFDTKTIDFFWLFGFSTWLSIETYSPALIKASLLGITLESALNSDDERGEFEMNYKQHLHLATSLLDVANTKDIQWPKDIPLPMGDREGLGDAQDKAIYDLVALALAFTVLHEFKHVQARAEEANSGNCQALDEEEMSCDTWARQYMTQSIGTYAKNEGYTFEDVAQKRAMGIALAAFTIHAMTPNNARWGCEEYPPIAERITAMIGGSNLSESSPFWCFTACLLISVMRQEGRSLDYKESSCKDFVFKLLSEL